jgi:hypothetical protein
MQIILLKDMDRCLVWSWGGCHRCLLSFSVGTFSLEVWVDTDENFFGIGCICRWWMSVIKFLGISVGFCLGVFSVGRLVLWAGRGMFEGLSASLSVSLQFLKAIFF